MVRYSVALARARGARLVIGIDAVAARREMASRFGADLALDPREALLDRARAAEARNGVDYFWAARRLAVSLRSRIT